MKQLLSDSLKEHANIFARVGKRYIINLNYIYQINPLQQRLILSDGENFVFQLSISKDALKSLKELYVASLTKTTTTENKEN